MSGPADENTPLLPENSDPKLRKATPLPKFQLGIVLLTLLAEPVSATYIFPFINQVSCRILRLNNCKLIRELGITGGDDRKIGYYAGLIESLFFVAQALTALHWSRLSDYIGRKPVLLIGLTASRAIAGAFDGNVGIIKSIIGEITDHTNMTQGFAFIPLAFLLGCSIAGTLPSAVIYVFTTKATPNKHSLGTINGLSQTATSVARAIGPAAFTSLFAFSKEHNLLEGNLVYVVLAVLACFLVFLSSLLPDLRNEGQENRDATNGLDTA
ncbi:hypothetical protein ID866_5532 [Astraeus odoratus]|nr:hypothetical protein ID866_5532 [Astraeus odoratus]